MVALGVASVRAVEEDLRFEALRAQRVARIRSCGSRFWMGGLEAGIYGIGALSYRQGATDWGLCGLEDDRTRMVQTDRW
jgi:hypothetical protein